MKIETDFIRVRDVPTKMSWITLAIVLRNFKIILVQRKALKPTEYEVRL